MSSGVSGTLTAYVDEAGGRPADGQWTYALGAVLLSADQHSASVATLRSLLIPAGPFLRHYDETPARRTTIAGVLAQLPLHGAVVVSSLTIASVTSCGRLPDAALRCGLKKIRRGCHTLHSMPPTLTDG